MATAAARARRSARDARAQLRTRLEARREEIEAAALTRVMAISDPTEISDPAYAQGLRTAVSAAVEFGIQTIEREDGDLPIPVSLLAQARLAARVGIPLDTVLRRYFAGYSLLAYFLIEEAAKGRLMGDGELMGGGELQRLVGTQAGLFDRLLKAVGSEHGREVRTRSGTGKRQVEQVERLLAGEMVDSSAIGYELDGWHLGVAGRDASAEGWIRDLATDLDAHALIVPQGGEHLWAWLGARRRLSPTDAISRLAAPGGDQLGRVTLAFSEPGHGLTGWRLAHRQAIAALHAAHLERSDVVRYADVALLALAAGDDLLPTSLRQLYLDPLRGCRVGGETAKETLGAYLAANRNVSSAAAALGVCRHTVANRLRAIEDSIERPLESCAAEIDLALRLEDLGGHKVVSVTGQS